MSVPSVQVSKSRTRLHSTLVVAVALTAILAASGCHVWRPIKVGEVGAMHGATGKYDLRLTFKEGVVELEGLTWQLDYPRVRGTVRTWKGFGPDIPGAPQPGRPKLERAFDLDQVQLAELHFPAPGRTTALVLGLSPVAVLAVLLAMKGSSCPIVQVDRGDHFETVGEGYPGAIFQCLQRGDLVQLPPDLPDPVQLRLANFAEEIQYTDAAELWAVDHEPGSRAVTTATSGLAVLGPAKPPVGALDLHGRDVLRQISSSDGVAWQTDLALARDPGSGTLRGDAAGGPDRELRVCGTPPGPRAHP